VVTGTSICSARNMIISCVELRLFNCDTVATERCRRRSVHLRAMSISSFTSSTHRMHALPLFDFCSARQSPTQNFNLSESDFVQRTWLIERTRTRTRTRTHWSAQPLGLSDCHCHDSAHYRCLNLCPTLSAHSSLLPTRTQCWLMGSFYCCVQDRVLNDAIMCVPK
jgi:hypothetical protein